jgi:hypothetical protein
MCPMFHDPRERCPHNPCLLGHDEAREAFRASKAFARCERLAKWQQEIIPQGAANLPNQAALERRTKQRRH